MNAERTLSLIKPDAVEKNYTGQIISRFEAACLKIVAIKMMHLTRTQAEDFYSVHKGKHFFESLVTFMSSGPIVAIVLEGENAVMKNRELMGATDPRKALVGTIRGDFAKDFGENIERNVVHGSDAVATAQQIEIPFFFNKEELFPR